MALILSKNLNKIHDKIIGFKFPFNGGVIFNPTYTTSEQIKANLINYILTNKKERIFNSNFGADLDNLLFENLDSEKNIKIYLEESLKKYFPLIKLNNLSITQRNNNLEIIIEYSIINSEINDSVSIIFQ